MTAVDICCLAHETGRMSFRNTWTAPQVRRALGWLAARNATGSSCYIRPARTIAETRWVLVDGLTLAMLNQPDRLPQRRAWSCRWSTGFQVWLRLEEAGRRNHPARCRPVAHAPRVGGDPRTVDRAQFGRLPGTTDRTPSRVRDDRALFVVLRSASRTAAIPTSARCDADRRPAQPRSRKDDEAERGKEDIAMPGNRDFAIACRLLEDGADDHTIAAAIAAVRGFDPKCRGGGYLPRTIGAARRHIQTRRQ